MTATPLISATNEQVVEGPAPSSLASILSPSITLAIWRRDLGRTLMNAAEAACRGRMRFSSAFYPFEQTDVLRVHAELAEKTTKDIAPIADDLIGLAGLFAGICDGTRVRVRLETVADDGCSRFHFDNVAMRLVVTYRGPGTQWVSPAFAADAYGRQEKYKGPVNQMQTGDVAIFRGRKSNVVGMTLHRSPPRLANSPVRILGVVDIDDG